MHDCTNPHPRLQEYIFTNEQGFGFVKKWDQMVGLRVILGVLEAGVFPGCAYLLSCWNEIELALVISTGDVEKKITAKSD